MSRRSSETTLAEDLKTTKPLDPGKVERAFEAANSLPAAMEHLPALEVLVGDLCGEIEALELAVYAAFRCLKRLRELAGLPDLTDPTGQDTDGGRS